MILLLCWLYVCCHPGPLFPSRLHCHCVNLSKTCYPQDIWEIKLPVEMDLSENEENTCWTVEMWMRHWVMEKRQLAGQSGRRGIYFFHLLNWRAVSVCMHACPWDHWDALHVSDKSRHVARLLKRVSMAMAEWGGRAGRFVRTHVEISIDLDET